MGLLKEQCAEKQKVPLQYCCNQVWMKVGGQILWNVIPICETFTDLLSDGKTPYERRFGKPFKGPIIPFGSLVEYHPKNAKDQSRIHQFGKKVLLGLFLGYALYAGWIWKGDILVADVEELETMDASEIYSKRLNAKEVIFPKEKGEFTFPIADGRIKTPRRRSGTENIHFDTAATNSRRGSHWLSWRIRRVSSTTSWLISGCRWSDDWLLVHVRKLHISPPRWTKSQTFLAERGITPDSTEIHWRFQNYSYEFGCQAREAHRWLLECWWLSRLVWSLDRFHTTYSTRRKSSWRIYLVPGETDEENSLHPGQIIYGQSYGSQHVCVVQDGCCIWTRTSIYLCLVGERSSQDVDESEWVWSSMPSFTCFQRVWFRRCESLLWSIVERVVWWCSWCGTIVDCPLLQEVCESCEHGAENAMWSAFLQHSLLCSRCCGACCEQQCCVVVLGNDFVFVLSVVASWGVFSWCVLCRRSVLNFYPDPCAVRSKLLMFGLVRCVSWMAFPSDTCFRVGGDFFTEGWRVSSVFADVVSLV